MASTTTSIIVPRTEPAGAGEATSDGPEEDAPDALQVSDVSSDTWGSVPSSPQHHGGGRPEAEDDALEQVTGCVWDGCDAGDLGNMDELVKHIHDHVADLQISGVYTCAWAGCNRKGKKQASGYALKAHMRSHTREKPFYCYLPECDRSFTRSDALAKHMRTVHENEPPRPSDPLPKLIPLGGPISGAGLSAPPAANGLAAKRLKIVIKPQSQATAASADGSVATDDEGSLTTAAEDDWQFTQLTEEAGFTPRELRMMREGQWVGLHRLCRAQLSWASAEHEKLREELASAERLYWEEWREKESLLEQVIRAEGDEAPVTTSDLARDSKSRPGP